MTPAVRYEGPAFFSYGFRPFFFSAALFAAMAVPVWVAMLSSGVGVPWHHAARHWHVHEMVFGFLPCVITGFLLTAIPNWTGRPPMRGLPLMAFLSLWVVGRVVMAAPGMPDVLVAMVDGAFLLVVAGFVWREIASGQVWDRLPIGILISLYAIANLLFHGLHLQETFTDLAERMVLAVLMVLLALIGGRIAPGFTEDFLEEAGRAQRPASFSRFDGISVLLVVVAGAAWTIAPQGMVSGWLLMAAGAMHVIRLGRWYGWVTWREPLVLILHVGYAWLALSFLILGGAVLGFWLQAEDAVHALTAGAVGAMTLGVMTRASLGHTGRVKHAGPVTVLAYLLVNAGAAVRVFGPSMGLTNPLMWGLAAGCWSGGYLIFVAAYGPILFGPSLEYD